MISLFVFRKSLLVAYARLSEAGQVFVQQGLQLSEMVGRLLTEDFFQEVGIPVRALQARGATPQAFVHCARYLRDNLGLRTELQVAQVAAQAGSARILERDSRAVAYGWMQAGAISALITRAIEAFEAVRAYRQQQALRFGSLREFRFQTRKQDRALRSDPKRRAAVSGSLSGAGLSRQIPHLDESLSRGWARGAQRGPMESPSTERVHVKGEGSQYAMLPPQGTTTSFEISL